MPEYTVIPDVHADLRRLEASLAMAGRGGKIAFLGDFIVSGGCAPLICHIPDA